MAGQGAGVSAQPTPGAEPRGWEVSSCGGHDTHFLRLLPDPQDPQGQDGMRWHAATALCPLRWERQGTDLGKLVPTRGPPERPPEQMGRGANPHGEEKRAGRCLLRSWVWVLLEESCSGPEACYRTSAQRPFQGRFCGSEDPAWPGPHLLDAPRGSAFAKLGCTRPPRPKPSAEQTTQDEASPVTPRCCRPEKPRPCLFTQSCSSWEPVLH